MSPSEQAAADNAKAKKLARESIEEIAELAKDLIEKRIDKRYEDEREKGNDGPLPPYESIKLVFHSVSETVGDCLRAYQLDCSRSLVAHPEKKD